MNTGHIQKSNTQIKFAFAAFLAVLLYVITYKYNLNILSIGNISDLLEHTIPAESITADTFWSVWLIRPYILWHLCVKFFIQFCSMPTFHAAACTCGAFAVFNYYVTFWILEKVSVHITKKDTAVISAVVSAMLSLVQPLYIPWINAYQYEGQFSINPIFNPTHMAVKPFGLLAFAVAVDLLLRYKEKDTIFFKGEKSKKWLYVIFALFLFLSTIAKPTFIYMLIPTGIVFVLIELVIALLRKDKSWKKTWNLMWKLACACLPSLIYLILEYSAFYIWGGTSEDASVAIYPFLTGWHLYSANVPASIVMGMSLPLWMIITSPRYFIKSVEGRLGALAYAVGALEFSFFVETGERLAHLNFAWPLMSGMLLLWVMAGCRLIQRTVSEDDSLKNKLIISVGWILLSIHVFSGLYYINPSAYIL
ncbi:MAG: hypothetical protein E7291_09815 [Lachnospiraceae bacterium]|nr:hypothetical protein [Lachnospiraceae bacterium]